MISTTYTPRYLKLWTMPDSYYGEQWPEWYVVIGQHRDSDSLTRSNFTCMLRELGGETETVKVIRESHWAVGWIEWIGVHKDDTKALEIADRITHELEGYPVVDEDHWSQLEWDEAHEYWASMSLRERIDWCRDYGCSIFSARLNQPIPDAIYEAITHG